jgi:hypothetical protein
VIEPIEIPDATREPAAYVRAMCEALSDRQWRTPMADGEWSALQVAGHDLAHLNQLARTVATATRAHG